MRFLYPMLGLGFIWRLYIAGRTPIPSEDGVNYLWMAERFAEGEFTQGLSEVFPPLLSLLAALPIAVGLDPFRSAQLVLCLAGTLAILPLARATEVLVPGGGPCAGCLLAFAHLPVRFCGEVYTEPLFLAVAGMSVWAGVRQRWISLGLWAGLGFWLRPEALVVPLAFAVSYPRRAWRALLPGLVPVLALTLWRAALGLGFAPVAKLDLILERSVASDGTSPIAFGEHLVQIPWLSLEAYGPMALLALWGTIRNRRPGMKPLYWAFLLAVVIICIFLPRRRFLVSWLVVITPIAAAGFHALPRGGRMPLLWAIVAFGVVLGLRTTDPNRIAERQVGEFLAANLLPGEQVTGDMTRVVYYSGRRPLVPRRFSAEEIAAAARDSAVRYVVLGERRETTPSVRERLAADFAPVQFPGEIEPAAADRGILVLERK